MARGRPDVIDGVDCPMHHDARSASVESAVAVLPLEDRICLAREAYQTHYYRCFWFMKRDAAIGEAELPVVARHLALNGGREGWMLAAKICPSHHSR